MIWKAAVILGVVLGTHGYAISEQKFIRHFKPVEHQGHHGELVHLGEHKPEHHHVYADAYPLYEYSYKVEDPHTHDFKGQEEKRDGDLTKGSYWLIQPDGVKRVVEYEVDGHSGFKANVQYLDPHHEHKHEERLEEERIREEHEREEHEREEREREEREREERIREEKEREERERDELEREERLREERIREEHKQVHYKHEPKIHIHHEVIKHKEEKKHWEEPKGIWEKPEKKEEEREEENKDHEEPKQHWEHKPVYIPIVKYYQAPIKYELEHRIPISKYEHDIHHEIPVLKHPEEIENEHNPHAPILIVKEPIRAEYHKPTEWNYWNHGHKRVSRKSAGKQ